MTADQYAPAVLKAGQDLGITERGIVIGFATVYVESDWVMYANEGDPASLQYPHDAVSTDANSDGLFQQRDPWWGTVADRMDPYRSAKLFFAALARLDYNNTTHSPGWFAQQVQLSAYPDRYDQRIPDAQALYDQLTGGQVTAPADPNRPDFNEYWVPSSNSQGRDSTLVDLWLIHTQEGAGNADSLAHFLADPANQVSYHYTISEDPDDHGVTVCDIVDTDFASWSVLSANDRSINLCFAGSSVSWDRAQWLEQRNAIEVAAYLCAQDCHKYGIAPNVIKPPYASDPPGISDHRYVTDHLGDGTHTDVGPGFPWDVFAEAVARYTDQQPAPAPAPDPAPSPLTDRELLQEVWDQLRGPGGNGWPQLGGRTLVDAVAELLKAAPHGN